MNTHVVSSELYQPTRRHGARHSRDHDGSAHREINQRPQREGELVEPAMTQCDCVCMLGVCMYIVCVCMLVVSM